VQKKSPKFRLFSREWFDLRRSSIAEGEAASVGSDASLLRKRSPMVLGLSSRSNRTKNFKHNIQLVFSLVIAFFLDTVSLPCRTGVDVALDHLYSICQLSDLTCWFCTKTNCFDRFCTLHWSLNIYLLNAASDKFWSCGPYCSVQVQTNQTWTRPNRRVEQASRKHYSPTVPPNTLLFLQMAKQPHGSPNG
jgi:hypothetical protein